MDRSDAAARDGAPGVGARRPPVNPWHRALAGVWGGALIVAAALVAASLVVAAPPSGLGVAGERLGATLLGAAGWFLTVAVVAIVAQLAAAAASWRPPSD